MPVDPAKAIGCVLPESKGEWSQDDVILYHLGVGAGVPATDPNELTYTYEGNLKVLPSYGVIPVSGALGSMAGIPGVDINFALVLHGEQDLEIKKTIPTQARVVHKSRVADIFDKGKAALIILEVETAEALYGDIVLMDETWIHDINASYIVNDELTVYGGINNLTQEDPFMTTMAFPASPRGRMIFVGGTYRFN